MGDTGATGSQGQMGDTGATGIKGDMGDTGATGIKGDTGATGSQGQMGDTGATGIKGDMGDTGATGPQGWMGDTGATGSQGIMGYTGPQGNTIIGPVGATGPRGPTGVQGPRGFTGLLGPTGHVGLTGPTGSKGNDGSTGPFGSTGIKGDTGSIGPTGPVNFFPAYCNAWSDSIQNIPIGGAIVFNNVTLNVGFSQILPDTFQVLNSGIYFCITTVDTLQPNAFAVYINGVISLGSWFGANATAQDVGESIFRLNAGDNIKLVNQSSQGGLITLSPLGSGPNPTIGQSTASLSIFKIA